MKMSSEEEDIGKFEYVEPIQIPSRLPAMTYRYQITGGNNKTRPLLIKYGNGEELRLTNLNMLKKKIIETKLKYVYPITFVEFAKKYVKREDVKFRDREMFKLRIWANQLRDYHNSGRHDVVDYLTYMIGCKIVKYASKQGEEV